MILFDLLSTLFKDLQSILLTLRSNAWYIAIALLVIYYVHKALKPVIEERRKARSYAEATNPARVSTLNQDLKRVRLEQQEVANRKAKEASELKKKREAMEL